MVRKAWLVCGILASFVYVAMTLVVGMLWDGYRSADQTISELSAVGAPTIAGALIMAQTVFGYFWPPMHQRAVLAVGGGTLTDSLHLVWATVSGLFFLSAVGFGAWAFGKRFRIYSIATLVILLASGVWNGTYVSLIQANLPTPWAGVWERITSTTYMVWVAVLATTMLRIRNPVVARGRKDAVAAPTVRLTSRSRV